MYVCVCVCVKIHTGERSKKNSLRLCYLRVEVDVIAEQQREYIERIKNKINKRINNESKDKRSGRLHNACTKRY